MSLAQEITNLYLYGQSATPSDLSDASLIRPNSISPNPVIDIDQRDYMQNGGGRFAIGSQFYLIQEFFDPVIGTPDVPPRVQPYTKQEIDATYARLIYDLFSKPPLIRSNSDSFLEIPSIRDNCLGQAIRSYPPVRLSSGNLSVHQFRNSFNCVPEQLRKPLLSLFKSSEQDFVGSFEFPVFRELEYHCQSIAKRYYSKLYPRLAVKALHILENVLNPEPKWWTEIVEDIEPVQECPKPANNQFNYSY